MKSDKFFYTDEQNAQIVIALLKAHGIRKVVASPGTTNIPITGSIQNDPDFEVWSAADERSAAYIACGLAMASGEPVALSCTGATASRNYLPGLTEAYYRKLPVIAITSMMGFAGVGNLVPQCIDRSVFPKDATRTSVFLPTIKDAADFATCERVAGRAILEAVRHGGGPVHLNLETSYKGTFNTRELPPVRIIRRVMPGQTDFPPLAPSAKVAVFIGAHQPFSMDETHALEAFARARDAVVFCDHTSSYRGAGRILSALPCAQTLSSKSELSALKPDCIVHIGEISGDYPTQTFLDGAAPVWRVSEDGEIRDKFRRLEYVFEMRETDFFRKYTPGATERPGEYRQAWADYEARIRPAVPELPFSNAWIARTLAPLLPKDCVLHLGILNSLRCWNCFDVEASIATSANVGGFGIDGCVSTLIGASLAGKTKLHFGVFGDLAFFYDLNSLGNRHVGTNLRILLVNNGGGGEFKLASHFGSQFGEQTGDFIAAAGHYGNKSPNLAKHYAQDLGFRYLRAGTKEEFLAAAPEFVSPDPKEQSVFFECFTDFSADSDALAALDRIDTSGATNHAARQLAGRILPASVKKLIKHLQT
jgi:2-succinyl-5-enolpyruvyl-6-hydroxy-3-cyclohexene-1-carboxylate synthase